MKPKRSMVRKQVLITADQSSRLKSLAAATGRAEGDLVREGIEKVLDDAQSTAVVADDDWRAGLLELWGMWADRDDLDEFYAKRREARSRRRQEMNKLIRQRGSR